MKNSIFLILFASFSLALTFSCSLTKSKTTFSDNAGGAREKDMSMVEEKANWQLLNSDYLFDQNTLHTFELNLHVDSLKKLDDAPADEVYVEGSLTFDGEKIEPVGIRYKGSIGSFAFCLSGEDWTNPSGYKTCTKISMKVKIDWKKSDQTFYGLKKLQFHSMNHDKSQMRDRLGYSIFRDMGVVAPRSVHARLIINGKFQGLYAFIEQIDEQFVNQFSNDGGGNLYKEVWPMSYSGSPQSDEIYKDGLETNKKRADISFTRSFAKSLEGAKTDEKIQAILSEKMDVQNQLNYVATDRAIDNDDGAFHWYCGKNLMKTEDLCAPHNFYWYEKPNSKQVTVIPWDLDHSFFSQNPVTPIADEFGKTRADCNPFEYGDMNLVQRSATCDKLIYGWSTFEDEYIQALHKLIKGPYSEAAIHTKLDAWTAQISDSMQEAAGTYGDAVKMETWTADVEYIKQKTTEMRLKIKEMLQSHDDSVKLD